MKQTIYNNGNLTKIQDNLKQISLLQQQEIDNTQTKYQNIAIKQQQQKDQITL